MALYQIIDGNLVPVTYILDSQARTFTLNMSGQTGDPEILVPMTDLNETLITMDDLINIEVVDRCYWVPQLVINGGSGETEGQDLTLELTTVVDGVEELLVPPLSYAFLSTSLEALEALRNQHVVSLPEDPGQYGVRPPPHNIWSGLETWFNSNEWWMAFDDIDLTSFINPGPELLNITVPSAYSEYLEYLIQPQNSNSFWLKTYDEPFTAGYYETVLRIDRSFTGYYTINWQLGAFEYLSNVGQKIPVYAYVTDLIGNCSTIVSDEVLVLPPSSRFYPSKDIPYQRRNHRYRGPRESGKAISTSDETVHSMEILASNSNNAGNNTKISADLLFNNIEELYIMIEHIRSQRRMT